MINVTHEVITTDDGYDIRFKAQRGDLVALTQVRDERLDLARRSNEELVAFLERFVEDLLEIMERAEEGGIIDK